jgi:hypothetical protein
MPVGGSSFDTSSSYDITLLYYYCIDDAGMMEDGLGIAKEVW